MEEWLRSVEGLKFGKELREQIERFDRLSYWSLPDLMWMTVHHVCDYTCESTGKRPEFMAVLCRLLDGAGYPDAVSTYLIWKEVGWNVITDTMVQEIGLPVKDIDDSVIIQYVKNHGWPEFMMMN